MKILIEKLVFGGQGLGRLPDGRVIFVWNALPGEEVEVQILKSKKGHVEGVATQIYTASPDRVEPLDPHFLSTGPWEVLAWEKENEWKQAIAKETYTKIGNLLVENQIPIVSDPETQYGYRNKMEFSFAELPDGTTSLAFFERGQKNRTPATGSALANPVINQTAQVVLSWINKEKIPTRSLKSLIVRSTQHGVHGPQTIAALFVKDTLEFDSYPPLETPLSGFHLFYSTHKSPASVPTELLYSAGDAYLTETVLDTPLRFGLLGFFQVNVSVFEKAVAEISRFVDPQTPLVDFYSGVGAISLPLSKNRVHATLVDNNQEAIELAEQNIKNNNLSSCRATCLPAEQMTEVITRDSLIILDPPRAGLHQKVTQALLQKTPPRIVYLSCDIATQARDMRLLSEQYTVTHLSLYNFFPRTPHIEGLAVLDRI
ncbi:MAG: hypothetical protein A3J66_01720 [Candidatus Magasanikbacteria bacterium RIFCSPHIGHO2_02_FULL_47_14]|uniref:TRAM domain-containing protein n=1 Tax=Candidatus Magasanikbacteria bacterium RIFCSPHIGHO2_02_FULL_47_14 TaxID=1798680 RepID=A0A1F6MAC5_9BACT|nr:MAG: hypothetical protein A3J66_01720 [Candidatus Magasanikbacteria bacterium RIFCSPHIGHO2_02_FULL_47_14]